MVCLSKEKLGSTPSLIIPRWVTGVIVFTAVAQCFDVSLTTYDEERGKDWKENGPCLCLSWLYFTSCHVPIFIMMSQTVLTVKNKLKHYFFLIRKIFLSLIMVLNLDRSTCHAYRTQQK